MIAQSVWSTKRLLRFAVESTVYVSHAGRSGPMPIQTHLYHALCVVKLFGNSHA